MLLARPAIAEQGAAAPVERLHEALAYNMRNAEDLGYEGRYGNLEPVVEGAFALEQMTAVAAGRRWGDLSDAERQALVQRFKEMTIANYAARFDDYKGQDFVIDAVADAPRERKLVRTRIDRKDKDDVSLDYVVAAQSDDWRIVDILLEGRYSELATRRSEYTSLLKREGYDGLIAALDAKIAEIRKSAE